ncbi:hypothetical protein C8R46DRAFT_1201427 [Mycena filopes]|nr:hypothetical protein C8R46DRAFT_1201427 [Mycena filopes]
MDELEYPAEVTNTNRMESDPPLENPSSALTVINDDERLQSSSGPVSESGANFLSGATNLTIADGNGLRTLANSKLNYLMLDQESNPVAKRRIFYAPYSGYLIIRADYSSGSRDILLQPDQRSPSPQNRRRKRTPQHSTTPHAQDNVAASSSTTAGPSNASSTHLPAVSATSSHLPEVKSPPPSPQIARISVPLNCSDIDLYVKLMLGRGLGYPMWCPGPNLDERLPEPYRRNGTSIGDVGLITSNGVFDSMFNIFVARDHPLNGPADVPNAFVPCPWSGRVEETHLMPGSTVRTHTVDVMAVPQSAYLSQVKRRILHNGGLYVVTGTTKTDSWGLYVVDDIPKADGTHLILAPHMNSERRPTYRWTAPRFGTGKVRSSNDKFPEHANQAAFITGFRISLGRKFYLLGPPKGVKLSQVQDSTGGVDAWVPFPFSRGVAAASTLHSRSGDGSVTGGARNIMSSDIQHNATNDSLRGPPPPPSSSNRSVSELNEECNTATSSEVRSRTVLCLVVVSLEVTIQPFHPANIIHEYLRETSNTSSRFDSSELRNQIRLKYQTITNPGGIGGLQVRKGRSAVLQADSTRHMQPETELPALQR